MRVKSIITLLIHILICIPQGNAQLVLNQEVCEIAKVYIENDRIEFRCEFTIRNLSKQTITIHKDDFELPCTCTRIELFNGLIVSGSSIKFSIVYALDPEDHDTYEEHLKEFREEGGRHQEIPFRVSGTSQEYTLMLNYFLKGLK
jgi:hypothetical protein